MTRVIRSKPVQAYVLKLIVRSGIPQRKYEGQVIFMAANGDELIELLKLYGAGKMDDRIIDKSPPASAYHAPHLIVETIGMYGPHSEHNIWPNIKHYVTAQVAS